MLNIIENLKKEPEHVRKKILHFVLIIFAIILILLWGLILKSRFSSQEFNDSLKEDTKPFNTLTDGLSNNLNTEN